jgi:hypothetical protein
MKRRKRCAVCGDRHQTNVQLTWKRHSDQKIFDICLTCASIPNKVTAASVNNYGPRKTKKIVEMFDPREEVK